MIFTADYIFPISGDSIKNGYVECDDKGIIIATGLTSDLTPETKIGNRIRQCRGIIVPGFINSHCHIELSHLKGLFRQGTGMDGFIKQINALRLTADYNERMKAMTDELDSLYRDGVSAMADISNCDESFSIKSESPLYTRTFLEVFGTEPEDAPAIISDVVKLQKKAEQYGIDAAPTPHSCYTMSPLLNRLAAAEGLKSGYISYHNQESSEEEDMIRYGTGPLAEDYRERGASMPPVTGHSALIYFLDNLQKECKAPIEGNVILVHNVATDRESINAAQKVCKHLFWALCPLSNWFIHRKLPPINLLRDNHLNICIGTDSLSSNLLLSMIDEIRCIQDHFKELNLCEILKWATLNGACAIGRESRFGSLDPGKQPGIVLIDNVDLNSLKLTNNSKSTRLI
ncbi:MAG: amidohydrolase family protein [Bacteroidales bacterium]|nr:amidohydrolase family protein [Bacteroidales bacterium]MDD4670365.1 amidohydrolase family protein [Bacteroidales bacterium]